MGTIIKFAQLLLASVIIIPAVIMIIAIIILLLPESRSLIAKSFVHVAREAGFLSRR